MIAISIVTVSFLVIIFSLQSRSADGWAAAQADIAETKAAKLRCALVDAAEVEVVWGDVLRTVRAGMLAVPSRVSQRLPHLTAHDVSEIDLEVRAALTEIGTSLAEARCFLERKGSKILPKEVL